MNNHDRNLLAITATAPNAYRIDAASSLLRFVATSGNKGSCSDFKECRMAGGLEMPEGQLEVAGADVIRARCSKTVVKKRNSVLRHATNAGLQVLLQSKI
jgi:hypothetical protein